MRYRAWGLVLCVLFNANALTAEEPSSLQAAADSEESTAQRQYFEKLRALDWQRGPTNAAVAGNSTLLVPEGYVFLDSANTDKYLELTQNIPTGTEVLVAPDDLSWVAYLSFDGAGYVKDNEQIDAAALLGTLKESNAAGNEERKRRGWPELSLIDWAVPPRYNSTTKRLEWATLLESEGGRSVNFLTKILGRRGYTSVILVSDPDGLQSSEAKLNSVLDGYKFNSGEGYTEWRQGDKVAEYGLAALVLGGAAAVATKKGFWAVLAGFFAASWKLIAAALVGLGAWLRSFLKKKA